MKTLQCLVLGLGSNLGERADFLHQARIALESIWEAPRYSRIYETMPWGVKDQPRFLNQVAYGWTHYSPTNLLKEIKKIEQDLGRVEGPRYGPRNIDIDILYYGDWIFVSDVLAIPHPRLAERAFTLVPLAEILPEFEHPLMHKSQSELLRQLSPDATECCIWIP